jgi:hypothetical protein
MWEATETWMCSGTFKFQKISLKFWREAIEKEDSRTWDADQVVTTYSQIIDTVDQKVDYIITLITKS